MIVYLAALQDIPRELVEAASIDGARRWGVFLHVVLPALRPVTVFLLVWQTFQSLQLFDLVYVTTKGGPLQSTTVVVLYVWQQAFEFFNAGYGAAAAYVLAFGLLVVGAGLGRLPAAAGGAARHEAAVRPWHLVLAPMALLFALPLLWLIVSSFMTNAQINRFPPTIIPDSLHLDGYRYVFETGRFRRWFLNSTIVAFSDRRVATSCSARSPATRSRACTSAARGCCSR